MIEKITEKDSPSIEWLLKNSLNGLRAEQLSGVVKILISKTNELTEEVNRLRRSENSKRPR